MTDPRQSDSPYNDPPPADLRAGRGNGAMWGWILGIVVVILIAFALAAGWNGNVKTASKTPASTVGEGPATQAVPPAATTGQGAGAPAIAPNNTAPQKTTPPTTPAPATPAPK